MSAGLTFSCLASSLTLISLVGLLRVKSIVLSVSLEKGVDVR